MKKRILIILSALLLATAVSGCSLLSQPPRPVLPTPVPTAPSLDEALAANQDIVADPVSDVVPEVDPAIVQLLDVVSQQQLMAYVQQMESFVNRNSFGPADSDTRGIGAARRWLLAELQRVGNGRLQVRQDEFDLTYNGKYAPQVNIVAELPGTDPGAGTIVIMAHYDNRAPGITDGDTPSPGANDNGSGVALLLESARVLSARQWSQTIIFLATAAEEQGTYGARHFAKNAYLDYMDVVAAINYDSVGGREGIPQYVRLFAPELHTSPSGELARYYDYVGGLYVPTFPVEIYDALDREGRWGDQREFVKVGMPSVRVIESQEDPDLVNSTLDTWDRIDYDYLAQVVKLNVAVAANLAGAPPTPPAPLVTNMAAPGAYLLTWATSPDATGYAISFRPLESATYAPFRFVRGAQAGNVAFTDLDPATTYAVSLTALDANGRIGDFSPEIIVGPSAQAAAPGAGGGE